MAEQAKSICERGHNLKCEFIQSRLAHNTTPHSTHHNTQHNHIAGTGSRTAHHTSHSTQHSTQHTALHTAQPTALIISQGSDYIFHPLSAMLNLTFELLKLFAEGVLPATTVQRIAAAAFSDGWGAGDEVAQRMQQAGSQGKHPGNCLRDLLRLSTSLGVVENTPEPYYVDVPSAGGHIRKVAVCLPHEQYHMLLQKHGLDAFRLSGAASAADEGLGPLLIQWGNKSDINLDTRDVAVLGLHADGVSYTSSNRAGSSKAVLVASWNVVSAPMQSHRGLRCLFFCLSKALCCDCGCEGYHTWNPLFKIFAWSMGFLKSGMPPTCRHDGLQWSQHDLRFRVADLPLARAALLMVRGDWEWLCQCFRFRHYSSETFCWCCEATVTGALTHFDVTPEAAHRTTLLTHER